MADLARRLKVSLPVVSNWVNRKRPVPADRCMAIEIVTEGCVRAETLRPDLKWRKNTGRFTAFFLFLLLCAPVHAQNFDSYGVPFASPDLFVPYLYMQQEDAQWRQERDRIDQQFQQQSQREWQQFDQDSRRQSEYDRQMEERTFRELQQSMPDINFGALR